ncbi:MAG TPA: MFS transporter [Pseudolabrys sp.]|nr:MFS transporter [Pseudolabrys sp.]
MSQVASTSDNVTAAPQSSVRTLIVAISLGNMLEWYDIVVYAFFAVYLSKAFFPNTDPTVSLLVTLATFGLAYFVRPIGGLALGTYADRYGRKASLMVSIVLMTIGTLSIAVMPTYETIGLVAPIAVLLARLLQGFSAGGEFGSSTAFLVERAPGQRGFIASWQFSSQGFATLTAALIGFALSSLLTPADLQAWGWRIPFFFGALIGPAGLVIRSHLHDVAIPAAKEDAPVKEVLLQQKFATILAIGALAFSTAVNYLIIYMPTYVVKTLKLPASIGFTASLGAGVLLTVFTPIAGIISDRIGRTTHMLIAGAVLFLSIYPSFHILTSNPTPTVIVAVVLWLALLKALYYGPLAALMSELFPARTRATGLGLSYNIGVAVFGGMGPAIMAWLGTFAAIGALAPSYYLSAVGVLSLAALVTIRAQGRAG